METYIAILRGINVSGKRIIKMADFRTHLATLSYQNIRTYIQSGNIAFECKKTDSNKLAQQIKKLIEKEYGFDVPTLTLQREEIKEALENNPFLQGRQEDIKLLHITFLAEIPDPTLVEALADFDAKGDEFKVIGNKVYVFTPNGYGRTKLNNSFFERKLKVQATTRNWKTVNKLVEL